MEELRSLLDEIKKDRTEERVLSLEVQERKLFNKLKDLEKEKETYKILIKNLKIEEIEKELADTNKKISNFKLINNELNSFDDLISFSDSYLKKEILENKIENYLRKILTKKSKETKKFIFIDKRIEECLTGKVNSDLIKEILEKIFNELTEKMTFDEVNFCEYKEFFCFIFTDDTKESTIFDDEMNLFEIKKDFLEIKEIISKIVKDKLMKEIQKSDFDYEKSSKFNEKNSGNSFFIKSFDDLTLDYCVKEIIKISKNEPTISNNQNLLTNDAEKIKNYYTIINKNTSKRKEKGKEMAQRSILKYFNNFTNINTLYIHFNNLIYLQKSIDDDFLLMKFSEIKDNIFYKIINEESIDNFDESNLQSIKIEIKKKIIDFNERLEKFFCGRNEYLFKVSFFEKSFTNFINYIFSQENLNENEAMNESLKCNYLINQCNLPPKEIGNYKKIVLLKSLLSGTNIFNEVNLMEYFNTNELLRLLQIMPWFEDLEDFLNV